MIDSVMNLVFRCRHKRLTRPVTPVNQISKLRSETYVACLECGKQFSYDTREMRIGKPLASPAGDGYPAVDHGSKHVPV
jgi:hypothetical protein